jgi:arginine decarboxylase
MVITTPTKYYLTAGSSEGFMPLNAFDGALLDAGVGNTNLVKMSSIIPPKCEEIKPIKLPYGALVPVAYAAISSQVPGAMIAAAVAACFPMDETKPAVIMEYSARGHKEEVEQIVRNMAAQGMKMRGEEIKEIKSIAKEHKVEATGAVWAGVVLWI